MVLVSVGTTAVAFETRAPIFAEMLIKADKPYYVIRYSHFKN